MENNRFEDSFRNAFAGAEVSPSAAVWKNIELDLEKKPGGHLKRSLLMVQLLAAASVAFAFGATVLYYLDQPSSHDTFHNEPMSKGEVSPLPSSDEPVRAQKTLPEEIIKKEKRDTDKPTGMPLKIVNANERIVPHPSLIAHAGNSTYTRSINRRQLSEFVKVKKPVLVMPTEERSEPDAGMVLLARLKDLEKKYQDEEKKASGPGEKIWASVGFGAGSYKPNMQPSTGTLNLNGATDNAAASSMSTTGASYSVGVSIATKISRRVIVQGGVSYLTQNADFTSTVSARGTASLSEYAPSNFDHYQGVSPYVVNSSMQFVSIPVQAGYLVVDRAFGVQLNGGIATDLFISNTLSPENNSYQKVTQGAGKDSPYRMVNFSGLLGTEFSYRIADHYRISINPGLRYSLHSIYKEEVAADITPVTVDVSLRFRYIFK